MPQSPVTFYMTPMSPASQAVWMVFKELKVSPNIQMVDILKQQQLDKDFVKINPTSTVPVIDDNGTILIESRSIMIYLVEKYGGHTSPLYPRDPAARGSIVKWMAFDQSVLYPVIMKAFGAHKIQHRPQEAADLQAVHDKLDVLEKLLSVNQTKCLVGNTLTLADMSLMGAMAFLDFCRFDFSRWQQIQRWRDFTGRQMSAYLSDLLAEGTQIIDNIKPPQRK